MLLSVPVVRRSYSIIVLKLWIRYKWYVQYDSTLTLHTSSAKSAHINYSTYSMKSSSIIALIVLTVFILIVLKVLIL